MTFYSGPCFDHIYKQLLSDLLEVPIVSAPRGRPIHEILFAAYELTDVTNWRIDFSKTAVPERQLVYDRYANDELAWYQSGNLQAASAPSKFWLKLADADGEIVSNYGYIVMHDKMYVRADDLGLETAENHVVDELQRDPDSRRAVMHYSSPSRLHNPLDIPCTVAAQLIIRNSRLHMLVFQRSCDVVKGLSYDVVWHGWLMCRLADKLGVAVGTLHHTFGSLHIYESDAQLVKNIITTV